MREGASLPMFFFFNDTATTEIYTLSLHDALPIWPEVAAAVQRAGVDDAQPGIRMPCGGQAFRVDAVGHADRKSTRLNSSHSQISYAVFCLKKKIQAYADAGIASRVYTYKRSVSSS